MGLKSHVSSNLTASALDCLLTTDWGDARVDDWGYLLSSFSGNRDQGSNPCPPAEMTPGAVNRPLCFSTGSPFAPKTVRTERRLYEVRDPRKAKSGSCCVPVRDQPR